MLRLMMLVVVLLAVLATSAFASDFDGWTLRQIRRHKDFVVLEIGRLEDHAHAVREAPFGDPEIGEFVRGGDGGGGRRGPAIAAPSRRVTARLMAPSAI